MHVVDLSGVYVVLTGCLTVHVCVCLRSQTDTNTDLAWMEAPQTALWKDCKSGTIIMKDVFTNPRFYAGGAGK